MQMTDEAKELWLRISPENRAAILNSVWCSTCRGTTSARGDKMTVEKRQIVIRGACTKCNGPIARVVETG